MRLNDLEAILVNYEEEYSDGWWFWEELDPDEAVEIPGIGKVTVVDSHLGGEGDWNTGVYLVFRVESEQGDIIHYRKTGIYRSFDGTSWSGGFDVVKPVRKYVTVFE